MRHPGTQPPVYVSTIQVGSVCQAEGGCNWNDSALPTGKVCLLTNYRFIVDDMVYIL